MKVYHMSGAGNAFVVMDIRDSEPDLSQLASTLCKRIGADGLMALDRSECADFRLHFYNADGSRGEMCGNGARCVCRFAYDLGIIGEKMVVQTDAGLIYAQRLDESRYRIQLNNPGILDLSRKENVAYVELGDPGIPHAVLEIPGLRWEDREKLRPQAKALRYDPAFPKGVNVNMYTRLDSGAIRLLTYERGVEDYTLACGTGSASTAVVLWLKGLVPTGRLAVENPGGTLAVTIEGENRLVTRLTLEGPTEYLAQYDI
jgi:diaminopimelate epimerase